MINKPKGWDDLEDNEVIEFESLKPGAYPAQIKKVIDVPEKEYLEVQFDLVKEPYKNYFADMKERLGLEKWSNQGIYRASYKETATKFFKAFITAVQKSNQGYVWDWNPASLVGKYMVAVFGEEEYESDGEVKVSSKVREIRSVSAFKAGDIKIPQLKKLKAKPQTLSSTPDFNFVETDAFDDSPF